MSISTLSGQISLSQATVTSIIDRLESRGLVQRKRSKLDSRVVHVLLTPDGERVLESAPAPLQEQFSMRFADLEDWEQTLIITALQRVASLMNGELELQFFYLLSSIAVVALSAGRCGVAGVHGKWN